MLSGIVAACVHDHLGSPHSRAMTAKNLYLGANTIII
jgi:hypothetical protein